MLSDARTQLTAYDLLLLYFFLFLSLVEGEEAYRATRILNVYYEACAIANEQLYLVTPIFSRELRRLT